MDAKKYEYLETRVTAGVAKRRTLKRNEVNELKERFNQTGLLPDNIIENGGAYYEYTSLLSPEEETDYLRMREVALLTVINAKLTFFVVLAIIGIIASFIAAAN